MALRPISRMEEYRFPEDAWDVRGWQVRTRPDDEKVGKVEDMLLDSGGGLRYLDVSLGFLKKHVLVPLDHAWADDDGKVVWIERLSRDRLEAVPEYALDPEALDEAYERRLDTIYGGTAATAHRDLVAPAEDLDRELELHRLDAIGNDYRVAGEDPRRWAVVTGDGRTVGRVAELLVDPGAMRARFMDVALDEKELALEPVDRHVLLPVERVRLDRRKRHVVVSGLMAHDLGTFPPYNGLPVRTGQAREIETAFTRAGATRKGPAPDAGRTAPDDDWRTRTLRTFYRSRPRARGETRTETRTETPTEE